MNEVKCAYREFMDEHGVVVGMGLYLCGETMREKALGSPGIAADTCTLAEKDAEKAHNAYLELASRKENNA